MSYQQRQLSGRQEQASPSAREQSKRSGPGFGGLPGGPVVIEAFVVTVVLAAVATYGWHALSPDVFAEATEGGLRVSTAAARRQFGIEVSYGVVTAAAGLVAGALLMFRRRLEAVLVQAVLAGTGLLGAVLVWQLGRGTGPGDPAVRADVAEPGAMLEMPLEVESYAMLTAWPIAAIVGGAVIIAVRDRPTEPGGDE